jgi:hypothetical protein
VIVLIPELSETGDERDWQRLTQEQFLRGYAEGDAIYDALTTYDSPSGRRAC